MQQKKIASRLSKAAKAQRTRRQQQQHTDDTAAAEVSWGERLDTTPATPSTRRVTRHSGMTNKQFYRSVIVNGREYTLGQAVRVQSPYDEAYLAVIYKLWENEQGERQMVARWLLRPHEMFLKQRLERVDPREVFYSNAEDLVAPETILGPLSVVALGELDGAEGEARGCSRSFEEHGARFTDIDWPSLYRDGRLLDPRVDAELFGQKGGVESGRGRLAKRARDVKSDSEDEMSTEDEDFQKNVDASDDEEEVATPVQARQAKRAKAKAGTPAKRAAKAKATRAAQAKAKTPATAPRRRARLQDVQPLAVSTALSRRAQRPRALQSDAGLTIYEAARARLHVSAVPDALPCREDEFAGIYGHLHAALSERTSMCMYISGVPGTGKTATVLECVRALEESAREGEVPEFQFVELNGMRMTEPAQAYAQLWQAISGDRATPRHAAALLERHFGAPSPRRHTCVVLVDELDLLVTKSQSVMYNFFDWPHRPHAKLIVIAVANTMDLPERVLHHKVSSRLGLTRINFQPYAHRQLMLIVESRLSGCAAFDADAIELCARKISAVSGDARRALDVCRRAVEIAEHEGRGLVSMMVIDRAVKEMYAAGNVAFIQRASKQQKVFLVALRAAVRKAGVPDVPLADVSFVHRQLCQMHHLLLPSHDQVAAICAQLAASRCVLAESSLLDVHQQVRLAIADDDITVALKPDPMFSKLAMS
ncbi:Origin recognition complex, subunit 1 [Coemansia sp. RSA 2618]|nr:Origin recognition complex, subunit 1 [Coemansia sp. RSA 2618]